MISIFFSYSHNDQKLRDQLEVHLSMLKRQGVISAWHDRRLLAGSALDSGISVELDAADIILLLVSADFLASDYCYSKEMLRAMKRHDAGEARVIPIILRPCEWQKAPFGKLVATPTDGKPVTKWADPDDAFLDITKAIRSAAEKLADHGTAQSVPASAAKPLPKLTTTDGPRTSNLRMRSTFTEQDKDIFLDESFDFMARFFENSLEELKARNPGHEGAFKRIDANKFDASIYRKGEALCRCQIRLGGSFGKGITLSHGRSFSDSSINENLSVHAGEQALYLKPMGMAMFNTGTNKSNFSPEGAAEYYWGIFIQPLQQ
ncbi:MAG: toll/interleukin-1 receptor domain-containing protein [Acidobacteriota bacterium]|nr:toll/interleukin-1 receptor domain-containing protein [Acidobacteriota bacterium]